MTSILRLFLKLFLSFPDSWKIKLTGGQAIQINGNTLHPDFQLIAWVNRFIPNFNTYKPAKARKVFDNSVKIISNKPIFLPKIETTVIGGMNDSIKIRIYNSDPTRDGHPILVYFHGGGHVVGNINTHDNLCRYLSYFTPCLVFSVDYRLAPEHPFPGPLNDTVRAYQWIKANAIRLGGNPDKIAIAGDSAGGNLALATAIRLKETNQAAPNFIGMLYPMVDVSKEHASYNTFQDGFLLSRSQMRWFINHHTPNTKDRINPEASPLLYSNFKNFPNFYISTAGFDPLSDEGKELADMLRKDKVQVVHTDFPNLVHGYASFADIVPAAWDAIQDFIKYLKTEWSGHLKTESPEHDNE